MASYRRWRVLARPDEWSALPCIIYHAERDILDSGMKHVERAATYTHTHTRDAHCTDDDERGSCSADVLYSSSRARVEETRVSERERAPQSQADVLELTPSSLCCRSRLSLYRVLLQLGRSLIGSPGIYSLVPFDYTQLFTIFLLREIQGMRVYALYIYTRRGRESATHRQERSPRGLAAQRDNSAAACEGKVGNCSW